MALPWAKTYVSALSNPRLRRCSTEARLAYQYAILLAQKCDFGGALADHMGAMPIEDIADVFALSTDATQKALDELIAAGFLARQLDGSYFVERFVEFQAVGSTPRVQKHRSAKPSQHPTAGPGPTPKVEESSALPAPLSTNAPLSTSETGCNVTETGGNADDGSGNALDRDRDKTKTNPPTPLPGEAAREKSETEPPASDSPLPDPDAPPDSGVPPTDPGAHRPRRPVVEPFGLAEWMFDRAVERGLMADHEVLSRDRLVRKDISEAQRLLATNSVDECQARALRFLDAIAQRALARSQPTIRGLSAAWKFECVAPPQGRQLTVVSGRKVTPYKPGDDGADGGWMRRDKPAAFGKQIA